MKCNGNRSIFLTCLYSQEYKSYVPSIFAPYLSPFAKYLEGVVQLPKWIDGQRKQTKWQHCLSPPCNWQVQDCLHWPSINFTNCPSSAHLFFIYGLYWPPYSTNKFISCVIPGSLAVALSLWRRDHNRMDSGENDDTQFIHDNARSHTAAVTDLLRLWQWEILELTRYESMRLRSLRLSERTTARDTVQHKRWIYLSML